MIGFTQLTLNSDDKHNNLVIITHLISSVSIEFKSHFVKFKKKKKKSQLPLLKKLLNLFFIYILTEFKL